MIKTRFISAVILLAAFFCLAAPAASRAENPPLPAAVLAQVHASLAEVGYGTYRKFGFSVYRATLWAPGGVWDATKPYALQLYYTRDVDKGTLVDTVIDDIRDQNVADDATVARWKKILDDVMPNAKEDDVIIGITIPGKKSMLFYNGTKIASIEDEAFSHAFFNVWLGDTADRSLRKKLLGQDK